jgi:hypothetical protein
MDPQDKFKAWSETCMGRPEQVEGLFTVVKTRLGAVRGDVGKYIQVIFKNSLASTTQDLL